MYATITILFENSNEISFNMHKSNKREHQFSIINNYIFVK